MLLRWISSLSAALLIFNSSFAQVNLQTGSATFSLPMFNWQDSKSRLYSAVALTYNSGNGLKVNDIPSNVGQGWELIAGGVITRMQVGEPDDQPKFDGLLGSLSKESDITKYPAGFLYATIPSATGCPAALAKYPLYGERDQLYKQHNVLTEDKQPDYFAFQFNGKGGMFILDTTGGDHGIPLGDSKLKITFQRNAGLITNTYESYRTTITSFTIQDVDGLIYRFRDKGRARVYETDFSDDTYTYRQTVKKFKAAHVYHSAAFENTSLVNSWVTGSWYLSEIEDPFSHPEGDPVNHLKITFTYNSTPTSVTNNAAYDVLTNETSEHNYALVTHKISSTQTPRLNSINFPDGHVVTLSYNTFSRIDLSGDAAINSVSVTYQGRSLSKYLLNTAYFIRSRLGNPTSPDERNAARLCLKSVQKLGVDLKEDTPPYIFDYYLGTGVGDDFVPPIFFWAKDVWGYYNGQNSLDDQSVAIPIGTKFKDLDYGKLRGLCFLRGSVYTVALNAKPGLAKNGLLKQIIYPTGGTLSYEYDQNIGTYAGDASPSTIGGVHVSKTNSTDGGYSNGCANKITTNYNYVLDAAGNPSSIWGIEKPRNTANYTSYNHYSPFEKRWGFSWSCLLTAGCCHYNYQFPGILSQNQATDLSTFQKTMNFLAPFLGILSVVTTVMDIVTVVGASSGPFAIVALVIDIIGSILSVAITCLADNSRTQYSNTYFNSDLNAGSPLPAQFQRVEVTESPGTEGKTIYEFTNASNYAVWVPDNPIFSSKQRFAPWAYGLPTFTTVWDKDNHKIKQTENIYDWSASKLQRIVPFCSAHPGPNSCYYTNLAYNSNTVACKCVVKETHSQKSTDWNNTTIYADPLSYQTDPSTTDMNTDFYTFYSGRVELLTTKERVYNPLNDLLFTETVSNYTYNDGGTSTIAGNYEIKQIRTTQSNGDQIYKDIEYTTDYASTVTLMNTLTVNNLVSLPVKTTTSILKSGSGTILQLNKKETEFTQLGTGDIKPYKIIETRSVQPNVISTPKEVQKYIYDNTKDNLIGLIDEGGRQVTNIYDYNDKYIVASVINSNALVDKPAYTSFETTDFTRSGWTLTGAATFTTSVAVTGSQSFILSAGKNFSTSLNTAKAYTVSFWSTSSLTVSAGATLSKSAPSINGMTYYEYDIAAGTSTFTLSGVATLDELRLYPKAARMRSTSYDPLIGKTAECDENNRITYYEYDNLARLRFIKDEYKNIVKMYEYNNVSAAKQNGCPGTYGNQYILETFTKAGCGAGYIGSDVGFQVPANTYVSSLSQGDADTKAENSIQANGQDYANSHGSCIPIYFNTAQSQPYTTQTCGFGYTPGTVSYSVPANRYSSLINVGDANDKAIEEIEANGQMYANTHPACSVSTTAQWEWIEGEQTYCQSVGGALPPHQFIVQRDKNPNSATYNQTQAIDIGTSTACPAGNYYNIVRNQTFQKTCSSGYTGSNVQYTVQPGIYSSTVSQAAADQFAINDMSANGQNYANTNGTCIPNVTISGYNAKTGYNYNLVFTPVGGGTTYTFLIPQGTSMMVIGTIPVNTYNVTFYPTGTGISSSFFVDVYSYSGSNGHVFNNVSITASTTAYMY